MSRHKIRYILPLLTVMVSVACVGAVESPERATDALKLQREGNFCPEPVDQMNEDRLRLTLLDFETALDKKYENLLRRATTKNQKPHGLTKQYFTSTRSKWKAHEEELYSDPTITTDLKAPLDKILYLCDTQQTQYRLRALERF